jgi:hypothetical protein
MNPFTQSIVARVRSSELREFVLRWDALEALVVRVYRARATASADEREHAEIRAWLVAHYPTWRAVLAPHWRQALRAGRPCSTDPFEDLLAPARPAEFAGGWTYMQALPAAREALNRLVLESQ